MGTSAFAATGLKAAIASKIAEVQRIYLADDIPWVVGYSGGKDSTASLQLVWTALADLPPDKRHKTVHVICTDTLVENPVVSVWVRLSLARMEKAVAEAQLPVVPHLLRPTVQDSFWVNLLGKGYPAPRPKFRWCTLRLKIKPSNRFILDLVNAHGEAIVVLGTRTAESAARANVISEHRKLREKTGFHLSPNSALENCFIYSPVEDWSNDDVWQFLQSYGNPWEHSNRDLLSMYRGASSGGECPLVVDQTTESCGKSRFGCWVCTLVDEDKSMAAMVANDQEKEWLGSLLAFRRELDFRTEEDRARDRGRRDFRRMDGNVYLYDGRLVKGPYTQEGRAELLRLLLEVQRDVQENAPGGFTDIEIISHEELCEIRRIWIEEKSEIEDLLPGIYEEVTSTTFQDSRQYSMRLGKDVFAVLKRLTADDPISYMRLRELVCTECRFRATAKRHGIIGELERVVRKGFYADEDDAAAHAATRYAARDAIREAKEGSQDVDALKEFAQLGAD
jgi:DNA sulfur modification protein DndC